MHMYMHRIHPREQRGSISRNEGYFTLSEHEVAFVSERRMNQFGSVPLVFISVGKLGVTYPNDTSVTDSRNKPNQATQNNSYIRNVLLQRYLVCLFVAVPALFV